MGRTFGWLQIVCVLVSCSIDALCCADEETDSSPWIDVLPQIRVADHAVQGRWTRSGHQLHVEAAQGARLMIPVHPRGEYDFRVQFTRHTGSDSVALVFTVGGRQTAFDIDGWGQHLAGLQLIDGQDMREYRERVSQVSLENNRRYTALVQVRRDRIRTLLDGRVLHDHPLERGDVSLVPLWQLRSTKSLGLAAWNADTTFHSAEYRVVSDSTPVTAAQPSPRRPTHTPTPPGAPRTPAMSAKATPKKVLLVIANRHFFYREYADPRAELERAGIHVTVAAGRGTDCYPHQGSGEGQDRGRVVPDITLAQASADQFDAIVFSGGWGSSMYQYAFRGRYSDQSYNGDPQIKEVANRLIGDFVRQDKFVGGICHGVSVLAWARVDGRSPLAGKRAVAPQRSGPAGVYNGQRAQPPSRWNAAQNGARLAPARSVGSPSPRDDVLVDGKIITAEDDQAARHFGTVLAGLLNMSGE